jgi:hypothetical protein
MRKFHHLITCVLSVVAISGCTTNTMVQSTKCVDQKKCKFLGGYSIPSIVLDYTVSEDSAGVVTVAAAERAIPAAWIPLGYLPGMSSDDSVTYELEGGFLKSVGTIADDKSATIVAEVLKTFKAPKAAPGAMIVKVPKAVAFTLDVSSTSAAEKLLFDEFGLCLKADAQGSAPASDAIVTADKATNGIYYPVERQWRVIIWAPKADAKKDQTVCNGAVLGTIINDRTALVPMSNALARIDVDRTQWVKHEVTANFDKGRLTKVEVKKPSEAAAFASIPADVLKAIVGIPAELVQFKIDTSGKDKALAEALQKQLEAEQAYIKALEAAEAAKEAKKKEEEKEDEDKKDEDSSAEPEVDAPTDP